MSDAWWAFVQSLNPSTIEGDTLPSIGRVVRERFGGPDHVAMIADHEISRAKFAALRAHNDQVLAFEALRSSASDAALWQSRADGALGFTDKQLQIAAAAAESRAAA